ncbi:MAG: prephenate dehydratase [Ectothiorhodospiraceae bacterium]|nr:prephenate dehydratase [Ectothiorhodospiraceae bacterium]
MTDKLNNIRQQIDALDEKLQSMISERAQLAQQVAVVKLAQGDDAVFYRPEREAAVLRKVVARNQGPLSGDEMARLFREIMSACLALEKPMQVAFLGPAGTFTQAAALKHFGHSVKTVPMAAIDEVFREVESGAAHYGVVPVENSTEGVVNHTLDMFMQSSLTICGEVDLSVHHNLLAQHADVKTIKKIYSHQQSLAQCREWLDANLPGVERVAVSSNADAAQRAAAEENSAAIAGEVAAELYDLQIVKANIEDNPDNTTRFLIISQQATPPSGDDKTSLLIAAQNKPGALFQLLAPFANNDISMNRIESRPSRMTNWEYVFFIDINGHCQDEKIAHCLAALKSEVTMLKVLGSYPRAVL